jgi:mycothiol synthase
MAQPAADNDPADNQVSIRVHTRLDAEELHGVKQLIEAATDADGVSPISEHAALHLRFGGDEGIRHLLLRHHHRIAGYAHLDVTDVVAGPSAELSIMPAARGRGWGGQLARAVEVTAADARLRIWAHGEHPAAARLAASRGYEHIRELWQMRRSLFAALPEALLPIGISVRGFRPGTDDAAWLALNTAAFSGHPEQGAWTMDDLRRRRAEPWFDPAGFFVAEREITGDGDCQRGMLVGFHWTKIHGDPQHKDPQHKDPNHGHEPIGEVYVVGVHPTEQGTGLGRAMTVLGLRHLRTQGLREAMLYVEADNEAAIALYSSLGFSRWDTDVMYRRLKPATGSVSADVVPPENPGSDRRERSREPQQNETGQPNGPQTLPPS